MVSCGRFWSKSLSPFSFWPKKVGTRPFPECFMSAKRTLLWCKRWVAFLGLIVHLPSYIFSSLQTPLWVLAGPDEGCSEQRRLSSHVSELLPFLYFISAVKHFKCHLQLNVGIRNLPSSFCSFFFFSRTWNTMVDKVHIDQLCYLRVPDQ